MHKNMNGQESSVLRKRDFHYILIFSAKGSSLFHNLQWRNYWLFWWWKCCVIQFDSYCVHHLLTNCIMGCGW